MKRVLMMTVILGGLSVPVSAVPLVDGSLVCVLETPYVVGNDEFDWTETVLGSDPGAGSIGKRFPYCISDPFEFYCDQKVVNNLNGFIYSN